MTWDAEREARDTGLRQPIARMHLVFYFQEQGDDEPTVYSQGLTYEGQMHSWAWRSLTRQIELAAGLRPEEGV